jgi:phosphomannomutase
MNKILFLFDVDGTLTDSGSIISENMKNTIQTLNNIDNIDIGIVGGGKLDKVLLQIEDGLYFNHYFTECGCVYNKNIGDKKKLKLSQIYYKDIRKHESYKLINILLKETLKYLSDVEYTITGNFIDLRSGIIYISLIGMCANDKERKYFLELDKKYKYKEELLYILIDKAEQLNILDSINIVEGGSVGIAIYPKENDKIQVLEHLINYNEIHYFGDKYDKNGNDYNIINDKKVIGHPVNNPNDTIKIIKDYLSKCKPYKRLDS